MDDINFLRFLTIERDISNIENSMAQGLYAGISLKKAQSFVDAFVRSRKMGRVPRDLHLYIHVPFCATLCSYCHCSRIRLVSRAQVDSYQRLLKRQIKAFAGHVRDIPIASLFLGGGTPSLLPVEVLTWLFTEVYQHFSLVSGAQVNVEVNPASLTRDKVHVFGQNRVNRITVGVQSLDQGVLKLMGRPQTEQQVCDAVDMVKQLKGVALNIDLVAGLPGHSVASFMQGLKKVIAMAPDIIHINPFCHIEQSIYYRKNSHVPLIEIFRNRYHMLREAHGLLEAHAYGVKDFEAYHRRDHVKNQQQFGVIKQADSVLGLGPYAHSRFFGVGAFCAGLSCEKSLEIRYRGKVMDAHFHMAEYLIMNLPGGVKDSDFERVFEVSLKDVFGIEMDLLLQRKIIVRRKGYWIYAGPWTMEGLFEYFSQVKVLYGTGILGALQQKYHARYRPGYVYGFDRVAFMKKMQDSVFMLVLSRLGF